MIKYLIAALCVFSFILGQKNIISAYDPDALESSALTFVGAAYYSGCIAGYRHDCSKPAATYVQNVKGIWHENAWKGAP